MAGGVPDFAFQAEGGMSYKSFASELMSRVSESLELEIHGSRVGGQTSTGLAALKQDTDDNSHTGRNVLNMRFALGADDTAYLNSAIAMLFTGTEMDNRQLDLSGLSPPDVQKHIRKAVIAQLQSERRKRRTEAVRVITSLADQLLFYLSFDTVREFLWTAFESLYMKTLDDDTIDEVSKILQRSPWNDAMKTFKKNVGRKSVYYILLLLETALDTQSGTGDAIRRIQREMVGEAEGDDDEQKVSSIYDRVEERLDKLSEVGPGYEGVLQYVQSRRDAFAARLPAEISGSDRRYTKYCVWRGLVGLRGPLHDPAADDNVGNTIGGFKVVDDILSYSLPLNAFKRAEGLKDPTATSSAVSKTYRRTVNGFGAIVHDAVLAGIEPIFEDALDEMRGNFAFVNENPNTTHIEARMALIWKPMGSIGEDISKTAALQHAAARCLDLAAYNKTHYGHESLTATYHLMAAGLELRRIAPHARVILEARKPDAVNNHGHLGNTGAWINVADELCTTPHATTETGYGIPVDAGYSHVPDINDIATDTQHPIPGNLSPWSDFEDDNGGSYGGINLHIHDLLEAAQGNTDGSPAIFVGPKASNTQPAYSTASTNAFPIYQIRAELRDVLDQQHKNLVPDMVGWVGVKQLERSSMHAIVRYALLHSHALHEEVCRDAIGDATAQATLLAATTKQKDERSGIWSDMLREVSISNDRLYTFVRTLSGAMGEDASVLLSSIDETSQRAARAMETERKEIAKRVSDFQAKIVEIIIGGIVKTSHLEMRPDGSDGEFQVVDAEMAKEMRALASGESGRPFFEANVAVQGMINQARTDKTSLGSVVRGLSGVVSTLYDQLQTELSTAPGGWSAGISMLAQPRNSFMVHLRDDATAAIRVAYDRFSREFRGRTIKLYELVEGSDPHLSLRFAEFVAHVLIQVRSSSGPTALYVSEGTRQQTALQARAALIRLTNRASEYARSSPTPSFHATTASEIQAARMAYFSSRVVPAGGGGPLRGYIVRVDGRSDVEGGWKDGYRLPYNYGIRYAPYPQPHK